MYNIFSHAKLHIGTMAAFCGVYKYNFNFTCFVNVMLVVYRYTWTYAFAQPPEIISGSNLAKPIYS